MSPACLIVEHWEVHRHFQLINKTEFHTEKGKSLLLVNEVQGWPTSPGMFSEVSEFEYFIILSLGSYSLWEKFLALQSEETEGWTCLLLRLVTCPSVELILKIWTGDEFCSLVRVSLATYRLCDKLAEPYFCDPLNGNNIFLDTVFQGIK